MKPFADGFIQIVKWFINPIVFITVTLGVGGAGDLRKAGRIGAKALVYFEVVTTFALILGVLVCWLIRPGEGIQAAVSVGKEVAQYSEGAQSFSWRGFFLHNLTLQVLLGALLLGVGLGFVPARDRLLRRLEEVGHWVFAALRWVMRLAPLGAFGGMAYTVGRFGLASLLPLGKLMVCVYLTMAVFVFGVLGAVLRWAGVRVLDFLAHIRDEILLVLGTSSSEAALPQLMHKLVAFGCPRPVVGLVVPAGYSFNLDGTTLYLSMAVLFLAQVYRVDLTWGQIAALIGILTVTSKGAAGVTGSGFITLAMTLKAVGVIPVEGLALLIGVDRFMSEARAITNLIGNGVAAVAISKSEGVRFDEPRSNLG
jgi:aerobic C4-dicarboxylate transport protein